MTVEIKDGCLKYSTGDYVIYKREYLLKNLAREVWLLQESENFKKRFKKDFETESWKG